MPEPAVVVLEERKRLSETLLWSLQRAFYANRGPEAWKPNVGIPFYISSNPFIARAYARVMVALLRDLAPTLDREAPIHVVELAAGSGQFSYLFLRAFLEMKDAVPALASLPLRYVMTDVAESNVLAWPKNERLGALAERGVLDFARFDMERDREIHLVRSGGTLASGTARNPVLAVANYAFDVVAHDGFFVRSGVIHEAAATVLSSQSEPDLSDPGVVGRLRVTYEPRPMTAPCDEDPALDRVLQHYARHLADTFFLIPKGALQAIRTLRGWGEGRLFILCGDKAFTREDDLLGRTEPGLAVDGGAASMMVNLHAVGLYLHEVGGFAWHSTRRNYSLQVSALATGLGDLPEARFAFEEEMNGFAPSVYVHLVQELKKELKEPTLETVLAALRLGAWDPELVFTWRDALTRLLPSTPAHMKEEVVTAFRRVYGNFYPLYRDLPFELGRCCQLMNELQEALCYYGESLRLFGEHPLTFLGMALAHQARGDHAEALRSIDRCLAIKPDYGTARELKVRLEGLLARR